MCLEAKNTPCQLFKGCHIPLKQPGNGDNKQFMDSWGNLGKVEIGKCSGRGERGLE
jgi:hypothetical protein